MLRYTIPFLLRSPEPATAPAGGESGVGTAALPPSPRAVLTAMLAQGDPVTQPAPEGSPTPGAQPDPETVPTPATETVPGQETLPAENPPEETPESEPSGEQGTVLPESETDNAELTQALAGLSPTERQSALDLVKSLQPGEIPRIAKLVSRQHQAEQTIEALQKQNEELQAKVEAGGPPASAAGPAALPPSVAKLKTLAEVTSRLDVVESNADALQDFLDANPGDKNTVYDLSTGEAVQSEPDGKRFATRQQIVDQKAALRAEAKALPKRAQEITRHAQFNQAKSEARAKIVADFPYLNDPENADTKAAQQLLKSEPALQNYPHADYLALALARGHRELQAEAALRKNGNGNGKPNGNGKLPFGTPPARGVAPGKVPLGKPHAPAGGGTPRTAEGPHVKTALEAHGKNGSRSSLAEVISAAGL